MGQHQKYIIQLISCGKSFTTNLIAFFVNSFISYGSLVSYLLNSFVTNINQNNSWGKLKQVFKILKSTMYHAMNINARHLVIVSDWEVWEKLNRDINVSWAV